MCVNCMTSAEALLINSGGAAAAGWYGLRAVRDRLAGWTRAERRAQADAEARAFAASLGLDPDAVVGPAVPSPIATAPIATATTTATR